MEELTELQPALFNDFLSYIDRPQKTTQTYINHLRQFAAWLAYTGTTRPQRADIIRYRDYLMTEHDAIRAAPSGWEYRTQNGRRYKVTCRPTTAKQYLQAVRRFFAWASANGYYPDIAANIHAPKVRGDIHRKEALAARDVLTIEQRLQESAREKTEAAAHATKDTPGRIRRAKEQGLRDLAMFQLAVNAGLRCIELSRANVKDLEVKNGKAVLFVWGKGHPEPDTKKPLAPEVYETIRAYLETRSDRSGPLFVATGNRSGGQRLAETTISKILKKAMQQAGFDSERITAHTLRHTSGTLVMQITGDLYMTQRYMRHASPVTTEIYLHNNTDKQEAAIAEQLYRACHKVTVL